MVAAATASPANPAGPTLSPALPAASATLERMTRVRSLVRQDGRSLDAAAQAVGVDPIVAALWLRLPDAFWPALAALPGPPGPPSPLPAPAPHPLRVAVVVDERGNHRLVHEDGRPLRTHAQVAHDLASARARRSRRWAHQYAQQRAQRARQEFAALATPAPSAMPDTMPGTLPKAMALDDLAQDPRVQRRVHRRTQVTRQTANGMPSARRSLPPAPPELALPSGAQVRAWMAAQGVSRRRLADATSVHPSTIAAIVSGRTEGRYPAARAILAQYFTAYFTTMLALAPREVTA